jgi:hypothetical protein
MYEWIMYVYAFMIQVHYVNDTMVVFPNLYHESVVKRTPIPPLHDFYDLFIWFFCTRMKFYLFGMRTMHLAPISMCNLHVCHTENRMPIFTFTLFHLSCSICVCMYVFYVLHVCIFDIFHYLKRMLRMHCVHVLHFGSTRPELMSLVHFWRNDIRNLFLRFIMNRRTFLDAILFFILFFCTSEWTFSSVKQFKRMRFCFGAFKFIHGMASNYKSSFFKTIILFSFWDEPYL